MRCRRGARLVLAGAIGLVSLASSARATEVQVFEYPGPFSVESCEAALTRSSRALPAGESRVVDDLVRWMTGVHPAFRRALARAVEKSDAYLLVNAITGFAIAPSALTRRRFAWTSVDPYAEFVRFFDPEDPGKDRQDEGYAQLEQNGARVGHEPSRVVTEIVARLLYMSALTLNQLTDPVNASGGSPRPRLDVAVAVGNVPRAGLVIEIKFRTDLFTEADLAELRPLAAALEDPDVYTRVFRRLHHHRVALFAAHARALAAIEAHRRAVERRAGIVAAFDANAPSFDDAGAVAVDEDLISIESAADEIGRFLRSHLARHPDDPIEAGRQAISTLNLALIRVIPTGGAPRWSKFLGPVTAPIAWLRDLQTALDRMITANDADVRRLRAAREPFARFSKWIEATQAPWLAVDPASLSASAASAHAQRLSYLQLVRERIDEASVLIDLSEEVRQRDSEHADQLAMVVSVALLRALHDGPVDVEPVREALRALGAR